MKDSKNLQSQVDKDMIAGYKREAERLRPYEKVVQLLPEADRTRLFAAVETLPKPVQVMER